VQQHVARRANRIKYIKTYAATLSPLIIGGCVTHERNDVY